MGAAWFAVQTKPQREKAAADELRRQGLVTFHPFTHVRRSRRRGSAKKVEWVERPLYTGYVFFHGLPSDVCRAARASNVLRVVGFNGAPTPVPDREIKVIMGAAGPDGSMGRKDLVTRKKLKAGQRVRFKPEGPLQGCTAL